jgi:hypothetical protein
LLAEKRGALNFGTLSWFTCLNTSILSAAVWRNVAKSNQSEYVILAQGRRVHTYDVVGIVEVGHASTTVATSKASTPSTSSTGTASSASK